MLDSKIHDYVTKQKRLLELELRSEEDEGKVNTDDTATTKRKSSNNNNNNNNNQNTNDQEEINRRNNYILRNLQVDEWSVGLMGRTVVTLSCMKGEVINSSSQEKSDHDSTNNDTANHHTKNGILLPAHRLTVGDAVEIMSKYTNTYTQHENDHSKPSDTIGKDSNTNNVRNNRKRKKSGGVISAVSDTIISIALYGNSSNHQKNNNTTTTTTSKSSSTKKEYNVDNDDDDELTQILGSPPLTIVPKSSIDVHRKMIDVLNKLEKDGVSHPFAGKVIHDFFIPSSNDSHSSSNDNNSSSNNSSSTTRGEREGMIEKDDHENRNMTFAPFNTNLDESQIEAIKFCLQSKPISLIRK